MSNHYPGLENNDLRQLLAHTPDMHDQRLVSDIRSTAMEVASMSPQTQAATLVGMATANLVNRVTACRQLSRMMIEANCTAARKVDFSLS
jgi:hypothetical protein